MGKENFYDLDTFNLDDDWTVYQGKAMGGDSFSRISGKRMEHSGLIELKNLPD